MKSLKTFLRETGHDMNDVGRWVDEGLSVATPVVAVADPPIAPILQAAENALNARYANSAPTSAELQQVVIQAAAAAGQ